MLENSSGKQKRSISDDVRDVLEHPENWELIEKKVKPAVGKVYGGGGDPHQALQLLEAGEVPILNRLEHNLLSMQVDDEEPLFVLYTQTMRDIEGASLDFVLQALVKLVDVGFSKCFFVTDDGVCKPVERLTLKDLKRHASGYSEEDLRTYPRHGDYYLEITDEGRAEEAKNIYDAYYLESDE